MSPLFPRLLACIALFAAIPAAAQVSQGAMKQEGWSFLSEVNGDQLYMKADGAGPSGARLVWTAYDLQDSRDREGFSFTSVASLAEYDCAKRQSRIVRETFHEKSGLKGKTWSMADFKPTEWAESVNSTAEMKMDFACPR